MGFPIPSDVSLTPPQAPDAAAQAAAGFPDLIRQLQDTARAIATQYPAFSQAADMIVKASLQGMMNVMQTAPSPQQGPALTSY
ncbi:MAG TPA: hypothetical protein VEI97_00095 [bacterium]|nr:hypothetical protein [bacterium]